jgi:Lrp/AsnC family leucine-responsive transcriptional regulator
MSFKPDAIDYQIMDLLESNARIPNKEISLITGKSYSTIGLRIKQLEKEGYLTFKVITNDVLKTTTAVSLITFIKLKECSHENIIAFSSMLKECPNVFKCFHVDGQRDFFVFSIVENVKEFRDYLIDKILDTEKIEMIDTHLVLNEIKTKANYLFCFLAFIHKVIEGSAEYLYMS